MGELPQYDEIHCISDIHMGGEKGFQILKETARLANFIGWVGRQRPDGRVALILNGDVIDTLAESGFDGYIAMQNPVGVVERITKDSEFVGIWNALSAFVKLPGRTLVIVLGNHDLELSFPMVQRGLVYRLAGDDPASRSRIEFSTIGAGYPCQVGKARIFCTHGNEVDEWNFVRYEDLSRLWRRLNEGRTLEPDKWRPNAGTKMVRDVMNAVKTKYRWVDLLKPEQEAAINVLAVLDPSMLTRLGDAAKLKAQSVFEKSDAAGRLSAPSAASAAPAAAASRSPDQLLGGNLREALKLSAGGGTRQTADDMLRMAEPGGANVRRNPATQDQTLGAGQFIVDRLRGIPTHEALRRAIQDWIKDDRSFDVENRDSTYNAIAGSVAANIDIVITGHTHLHRSIDMGGGRHYFNTGTWIRLMRFTDAMLADPTSFKPVYDVLARGDIDSLDKPPSGASSPLLDQTSAVSVRTEAGGRTLGQLYRVTGNGTDREPVGQAFIRS